MANSDQKSCNRRPFVSDDECNRGSVDTRRFSDFPYCDSFSPTLPEIPPEIIDTPIDIQIPPPCSCFSMKYKMGMKYTSGKFNAKADFKADGDCCDGNYISTLNLEVPCPIKDSGEKKIIADIKYGKGDGHVEVKYMTADNGGCAINFTEPSIHLELPCPVSGTAGKSKIKIGIKYGSKSSVSASYMSKDGEACTIIPKDVNLDLELRCPIPEKYHKSKVRLAWGSSKEYTLVGNLSFDHERCELRANSSSYIFEIPCPIRNDDMSSVKMMVVFKNRYQITSSNHSTRIAKIDKEECRLSFEPNLHIDIPCPISRNGDGGGKDKKLRMRLKWGSNSSFDSIEFLKWNSSSCIVSMNSASYELELKCPIRSALWNNKHKIRFSPVKYKETPHSVSAEYLKIGNKDGCSFEVLDINNQQYSLEVPCPIKFNGKTRVTLTPVVGGTGAVVNDFASAGNNEKCRLNITNTNFKFNIPCQDIGIDVEKTEFTNDYTKAGITTAEVESGANCSKNIKLGVTIPRPEPILVSINGTSVLTHGLIFGGCDSCNNIYFKVEGNGEQGQDGAYPTATIRMCTRFI